MSQDRAAWAPGWIEFGGAIAVICLLLLFGSPSCHHDPIDPPSLPPLPVSEPTATPQPASASAKAKTRVVIEPIARGALPATPGPENGAHIGEIDLDGDGILDRRITIETELEAAATAPVVIITPPPTPTVRFGPSPTPSDDHTRLGVGAFTMPGVLAADLQIVRGRPLKGLDRYDLLPPEVENLELSADVVVNTRAAGLMAAAGSKIFVGVGYYTGFTLDDQGYFIGGGLRF